MSGRLGAGAAWAALPIAVLAFADTPACVDGLLVAAAVATLLLTVAPFLPGLHRLPLVGAPRLLVELRLNTVPFEAKEDGTLRLRHSLEGREKQRFVLTVELLNRERRVAIDDPRVEITFPRKSGVQRVTAAHGQTPLADFNLEETSEFDLLWTGRPAKLLPGIPERYYFAVVLRAGSWKLDVCVQSHSLYRSTRVPVVLDLDPGEASP